MELKTLDTVHVEGQRVLVRVDFNVPLTSNGQVADDTRILAALPTIKALIARKAKIILISHLGRPHGRPDKRYTLEPIAFNLSAKLGQPVAFLPDCIGPQVEAASHVLGEGQVMLLENVRFYPGEEACDESFSEELANCADVFVNDAFGTAHRAHASTVGITRFLPHCAAGLLMEREINYLSRAINKPEAPFVVVLGGAKVSDKIQVIEHLLKKANTILIGGAMAYTFLLAQNQPCGDSLVQPEYVEKALEILKKAKALGVELYLPIDHLVTPHLDFATKAAPNCVITDSIPDEAQGVDIGPKTIALYRSVLAKAKTILWNGPMGVFEIPACAHGTYALAEAIAQSASTSIIGGGDSACAIKASGFSDKVSFISTGGGASLEFLEGRDLPGIRVLAHN